MIDLTVGQDGIVAIGFMGDHLLVVRGAPDSYSVIAPHADRHKHANRYGLRTVAEALAELTQRSAREPVSA